MGENIHIHEGIYEASQRVRNHARPELYNGWKDIVVVWNHARPP